jgi:hypothetical protein
MGEYAVGMEFKRSGTRSAGIKSGLGPTYPLILIGHPGQFKSPGPTWHLAILPPVLFTGPISTEIHSRRNHNTLRKSALGRAMGHLLRILAYQRGDLIPLCPLGKISSQWLIGRATACLDRLNFAIIDVTYHVPGVQHSNMHAWISQTSCNEILLRAWLIRSCHKT